MHNTSLFISTRQYIELVTVPHCHLAEVFGEGGGARVAVDQVQRIVMRREGDQGSAPAGVHRLGALLRRQECGGATTHRPVRNSEVKYHLEPGLLVVFTWRQKL